MSYVWLFYLEDLMHSHLMLRLSSDYAFYARPNGWPPPLCRSWKIHIAPRSLPRPFLKIKIWNQKEKKKLHQFTKAQRMFEMDILATKFGEFEFSRPFWHFGNFDLISHNFWHFGNFNLNFPALFFGQEQKRKSSGKFTESCSEYHQFIHSLCFTCVRKLAFFNI